VGLYEQPNHWSCGPFALKHALVALGRRVDERTIARIARTHWWSGTDEVRLARAARAYDCRMPLVRRTDAARARRTLVGYLSRGRPVLLCVDQWQHWITAVGYQKKKFVVLDSLEAPVLQVLDWPRLEQRWRYDDEDERGRPVVKYDLHPVKPRTSTGVKAEFSLARARFLRLPSNRNLARHWDEYLADLLDICRPPARTSRSVSMAEFLRRHRNLLVARAEHWHGGVERAELELLLRNLRFVAGTYGLVIPVSDTRRAIIDLAILLTLWAAGRAPIEPLYRGREPKRRGR
jgi:hypothetical protein